MHDEDVSNKQILEHTITAWQDPENMFIQTNAWIVRMVLTAIVDSFIHIMKKGRNNDNCCFEDVYVCFRKCLFDMHFAWDWGVSGRLSTKQQHLQKAQHCCRNPVNQESCFKRKLFSLANRLIFLVLPVACWGIDRVYSALSVISTVCCIFPLNIWFPGDLLPCRSLFLFIRYFSLKETPVPLKNPIAVAFTFCNYLKWNAAA